MKTLRALFQCFFILFLLISSYSFGQTISSNELLEINKLIEQDSLQKAEKLALVSIEQLKSSKSYTELSEYIFPIGKIHAVKRDLPKALSESKALLDFIVKSSSNSKTLYLSYIEFSKLCLDIGELPMAYEYGLKARIKAKDSKTTSYLVDSEYYLADYAMKLGQINNLEKHIRSADALIRKYSENQFKIQARVYNLLGALMFFTAKQDSALFYFEKAIKHIPDLEQNVENQLYLPAAIKGNMSLIKLNQGKPSEAKPLIQSSINLIKEFLQTTKNHPLENRVKRNLTIGYSTLNGLHFDLGDFEKSDLISKLAYNYTKENFPVNSQEFFMASLAHAEVKIQRRDFDEALHYLEICGKSLDKIPGDNFQLKAFLYDEYANIYYMIEEFEKSLEFRELSQLNYKKSNPNAYDSNRLYAVMNLAQEYAEIGERDKALKTVSEAYNYFYEANGEKDYFTNALMLCYAKVYYNLGLYEESVEWSNKSIQLYNNTKSNENIDKLYFEEDKAEIYILNALARYHKTPIKDSLFLKSLIPTINKAIAAVEQRKTSITSFDDVSTLIKTNDESFDIVKKLYTELYQETNNVEYLDKMISLHESALYNRIRARFNSNPDISFHEIPESIVKKEKELRNKLANYEVGFDSIVPATYQWQSFLDTLRSNYPKYFKMRYATIEEPLNEVFSKLKSDVSIVRYLYIDENLYGLVVATDSKHLVKLNSKNIDLDVIYLSQTQFDVPKTNQTLHQLYEKLWKPLETHIKTDKVIIIPDGNLFNLSFESLLTKPIDDFKKISSSSLLSKHIISYNYSLLLLKNNKKILDFEKDFIAFAPEFNESMKSKYSVSIKDSLSMDKTYLSLLPQPFSVDLAKEYSKLFNGDYFINENASKQIFQNEANEHKIIHIGTHAESNNISPELSRLIFAKNNKNEDNSLYTYEIYNESLNSNLAILTACETGKPSYQAGEGMISLAHAFNYAGSESILTSLWKIDEKSSSEIIELFLNNLKEGMPKDKALQQAKLRYLSEAEGRTLAPNYWAGLVLIGDVSPVNLNTTANTLWYLALALITIVVAFVLLKRKNS